MFAFFNLNATELLVLGGIVVLGVGGLAVLLWYFAQPKDQRRDED
jgi:hypothetical protein